MAIVQVRDPARFTAAVALLPGVQSSMLRPIRPSKALLPDPSSPRRQSQGLWPNDCRGTTAWTYVGNTLTSVAILDTGLKPDHPEVAGRILLATTLSTIMPSQPIPVATHPCRRIIAAANRWTRYGRHLTRVHHYCRSKSWIPGRGAGEQSVQGIYYAIDHGADILNLGLTGSDASAALRNPVDFAYARDVRRGRRRLATSEQIIPKYTAAFDHVIAVHATDDTDTVTDFSNRGDFLDSSHPGSVFTAPRPRGTTRTATAT